MIDSPSLSTTPLAYCHASDASEAQRLSAATRLPLIRKPLAAIEIADFLKNSSTVNPLRLVKSGETSENKPITYTGLLYLDGGVLTLFSQSPISKRPLSLFLDFTSQKMRSMAKAQNKKTLIAKAIGAKTIDTSKWIVDATAGLGQDAFMLAYMGYNVTLLERSPAMAALLSNAISRVKPDSWAFSTVHRLTLLHTDARQWLFEQQQYPTSAKKPSVIYIDPMFPHPDKKALSQKSMQMLQQIVGPDADADKLLSLAQALATERVVVKRHRASPHLGEQKPQIIFEGKSHRFDVYR